MSEACGVAANVDTAAADGVFRAGAAATVRPLRRSCRRRWRLRHTRRTIEHGRTVAADLLVMGRLAVSPARTATPSQLHSRFEASRLRQPFAAGPAAVLDAMLNTTPTGMPEWAKGRAIRLLKNAVADPARLWGPAEGEERGGFLQGA